MFALCMRSKDWIYSRFDDPDWRPRLSFPCLESAVLKFMVFRFEFHIFFQTSCSFGISAKLLEVLDAVVNLALLHAVKHSGLFLSISALLLVTKASVLQCNLDAVTCCTRMHTKTMVVACLGLSSLTCKSFHLIVRD